MNPHNRDEFARAWEALDKPEDIRNAIDHDLEQELIRQQPGQVYATGSNERRQSK